jgi:hypothetical protein
MISLDLEYIKEEIFLTTRTEIEEVTFMLDALRKSQINNKG